MAETRRSPAPPDHSSEPTAHRDDRTDDLARLQSDVADRVRAVYRSATALAAGIGRAAGIHATDADALRLLDAASARPTMSELGHRLGLSSAAVTALVDRLEDAGLARRVRDATDRRRVHVELTESAHRFAVEQLAPVGTAIQRAIAVTPREDLVVVERFLGELLASKDDPDRPAG
jgi:DNA-binding MarR family transcriptional regulator